MRTVAEKLAALQENDVWDFAKHTTYFDESFKMVKLFSEIPDIENVNIERYFADNHARYGIATHRHRALIIAQLFGLLTKSPFFSDGRYKNEKTTAVFEELSKHEIGSPEYNTLKTEQLLKIRMKPIISTTPHGYDQTILPIIFSFAVLWELKKHGIESVSEGQFYTYVMTCKAFDEINEAVTLLRSNPRPSDLVARYRDKSRMENLLERNCNLLVFDNDRVSINDEFGNYFYMSFYRTMDMSKLNILLDRPADYAYFLYNPQGFGVNLIDVPVIPIDEITPTTPQIIINIDNSSEALDGEENYDANYVSLVDDFKEENINISIGDDAYSKPPQVTAKAGRESISKNPVLGKIAIIKVDYKCVANTEHRTFESKKTRKEFMEAHHLIPIKYACQMWERFAANIDCVENLVSLCPNCHRAVHYGSRRVKEDILQRLYNSKRAELNNVGINIAFDELQSMY